MTHKNICSNVYLSPKPHWPRVTSLLESSLPTNVQRLCQSHQALEQDILQFARHNLTFLYLTQDPAHTAADMSVAGRGDRGWSGWTAIGAIAGNTITAPRKNTASITAVPRGVVSSRTRVLLTLFRSWGPGACRYSAVPTCAPPPYSELTSR